MIIIPLGNDVRAEVISSVIGQLSDGIWENSRGMGKYWYYADVNRNNELEVDDESWDSGFRGKDEAWVRNWFGNKAKQVVKIWADDCGKRDVWTRDNQDEVDYMGGHRVRDITVADVYECYDYLKQRKGKYSYGKVEDTVIPEPNVAPTPEVSSPRVSGGMNPSRQEVEDFFTGASTMITNKRQFRVDASKKIKASYGRPNAPEICYRDRDDDDRIVMWDVGMSQEEVDEQLAKHPSWYRATYTSDVDSCSKVAASSVMATDEVEEFEDPRIDEADDLQSRVEDDFDYVITGIERLGREGLLDEAISLLNTLADTLNSAIGIIGDDFETGSAPEDEEV